MTENIDDPGAGQHEQFFVEIKTREAAVSYLEELVAHVEQARGQLDECELVRIKQRAFHNLLIRYGRALGALATLMHVRMLQDGDYARFAPRIHGAIVPRVITTVVG